MTFHDAAEIATARSDALPETMKALEAVNFSIDSLRLTEQSVPVPRRGEILIRIKAVSLNYRDLAILSGTYIPNLLLPFVPASDACGDVVAVGPDVTRFKLGDRVTPIYTQGWHDGLPTPEQRSKKTTRASPLSASSIEVRVNTFCNATSARVRR
ncbi:alcohol dehydrogenase catalytic domain-containing protein [Caballeronia sordidicola]|uniref:Alcohol dehydrogenase n=1 Tax=Caballeronia sordidicola TaxID=196367 RepID=A0A242MXM5_CABSO|nr:alcohol dehydrogenase catalytic domain-containing protein [Caballeronia sordidicola]OTP75646.1 Alcohol dehydrogenase [Caballeronia sordidicola]